MTTYRVKIRHTLAPVKPEALPLDGRVLSFIDGGEILKGAHPIYSGERAMFINDWRALAKELGADVPMWIASGDLEAVSENEVLT